MAILAAVLLVSSITALNDYNKEKQFRALSDVDADKQIKVDSLTHSQLLLVYTVGVAWW